MNRTKIDREREELESINRLASEKNWDEFVCELDRQELNQNQREHYHAVSRSEVADVIRTGKRQYGKPQETREYNLTNIQRKPWEDIIFDSPDEIDELVSDSISIKGLRKLTIKQKQALFYRYARGADPCNIANLMDCGQRNVIKHIHAGIEKFQKYVTPIIKARNEQGYLITTTHRRFLEWLDNPLQNKEARDRMYANGELEQWFQDHPFPKYEDKEEDNNGIE